MTRQRKENIIQGSMFTDPHDDRSRFWDSHIFCRSKMDLKFPWNPLAVSPSYFVLTSIEPLAMTGLLLYPVPQELAQELITGDFSFRGLDPTEAEVFEFVKEFLIRLQLWVDGDESLSKRWDLCLQMIGMRYSGRALNLGVSMADVVKFTTDDNGIVDALNSAIDVGHGLAQPCSLCD